MARPLRFYQKKCLREDNRKDEPILDQAPTMGGGSRKGNHRPEVTLWATKESRGLQSPPFEKASEGVFYSSVGSGATVGDQY